MDTERQRRIAENESLFRDVNERVEDTAERFMLGDDMAQEFLCECGDTRCTERITLTLREYGAVRANARQFAIVPGHDVPEVERVVASSDRYDVVEKVGVGAEIAEQRQPPPR